MRIFAFFFLTSILTSCMDASLFDCLKTIDNKSTNHSIRSIDFIYMINLDERPEKFKMSTDQLHPYGVFPYRFSAVNGWTLSLEEITKVGVQFSPEMNGGFWGSYFFDDVPLEKKWEVGLERKEELIERFGVTYFCHRMNRGAIGIVLSHLSILKDAYDSGYNTIWIMEDDIDVIQNPNILSDLIDELDTSVGESGWDVLFTDLDTKNHDGKYVICETFARRPNFTPSNPNKFKSRKRISQNFRTIGARYGAYSMIIRRSGVEKLLSFFQENHVFVPYDMDYFLPEDIKLFTVLKDVVSTTPRALSDNGKPKYLLKK